MRRVRTFAVRIAMLVLLGNILFTHDSHLVPSGTGLNFHFPYSKPKEKKAYRMST